jgi:hypothetical protein
MPRPRHSARLGLQAVRLPLQSVPTSAHQGVRWHPFQTHAERRTEHRVAIMINLCRPKIEKLTAWRDHLAAEGNIGRDSTTTGMAPATVNNHLAHLSALFSWITVHASAGLLRHGDPTKKVEPLRLPAPQVRTVKNVLDRIEGFHQLGGARPTRGWRERAAGRGDNA